jgi:hypothetical protein
MQALFVVVPGAVWKSGVHALTKDQFRDIYEGRVKNWKALGGEDRKIVFYNRDVRSSAWEMLMLFLYEDARKAPPSDAEVLVEPSDVTTAVEYNGGSICVLEYNAPRPEALHTLGIRQPDGSVVEVYARGVRNSVGFDWDPRTRELWFTDNGRDMMGDDVPPDELNFAPKAGMHFGYPYCHGGDIADPEFGSKRKCSEFTPPAQKEGAHVASLGMRFYTGSMFPAEYRNRIFIAEHGSWNRSKKNGYRVMQAKVEKGKVVDYGVFAEGWLDKDADEAWGRPVDVQVMPDGALLVSDDTGDAIYRISYRGR